MLVSVVAQVAPHNSSIARWDARIVAVLACLIPGVCLLFPYIRFAAFLPPLIIYWRETESGFVRFLAAEAALLTLTASFFAFVVFLCGMFAGDASVWTMFLSGVAFFFRIGIMLVLGTMLALSALRKQLRIWPFSAVADRMLAHIRL